MKTHFLLLALAILFPGLAPQLVLAQNPTQEGVAVAIVYDTSGSMQDLVSDAKGGRSPKYRIANRALEAVARQLEAYATNSTTSAPRKLNVGLFVFTASGAREAVPFGPLDAAALQNWARRFNSPTGGTPLGSALETAGKTVLKSGLARKHVLVITDGINTVGKPPAAIMPNLIKEAQNAQTSLAFHFVAFDVDAKIFAPLKKLGATVVSAANESQLNTQLDFILRQKILLEDEESPAKH